MISSSRSLAGRLPSLPVYDDWCSLRAVRSRKTPKTPTPVKLKPSDASKKSRPGPDFEERAKNGFGGLIRITGISKKSRLGLSDDAEDATQMVDAQWERKWREDKLNEMLDEKFCPYMQNIENGVLSAPIVIPPKSQDHKVGADASRLR